METRFQIQRPGLFGLAVAADSRRAEFDAHNEVMVYHQADVDLVFIGDSITHLWDLQTYFGRKGAKVVNRGIGGDTTTFVLRRFAADVLQLKPKYVVISIGINNTWIMDDWLLSNRQTAEQIEEQIITDIKQMISLAQQNGIIPIICSLMPTCIESNSHTAMRNELVISVNKRLREASLEKSALYVDYHQALADQDGKTLIAELVYDGIHPNVYGYNKMAEALKAALVSNGFTFTA